VTEDGQGFQDRAGRKAESDGDHTANLDQAVDTLAAMLRDYGANAFDLPERSAQALDRLCEQWANHVLFASPPPESPSSAEKLTGGRRDWPALRSFFAQQRHTESHYVTDTLTGMRQVLWTCVNGMRQSVLGNNRADVRTREQMERLKQVVQTADLAVIRREVQSVVTTVNLVLEEQKEQHRLYIEAMQAQIQQLDAMLAQARKEGALDALTQLYNRRAFMDRLKHALDCATIFETSACLFLVDADHFKTINDTYGHPGGDAVLRALADCLVRLFPANSDCVARYGGEEFGVVCLEMTLEDGQRMAERLLQAVRDMHIRHADTPIHLTVSIGLVESRPGEEADAWIERADRALYMAKQQGRDCYRVVC